MTNRELLMMNGRSGGRRLPWALPALAMALLVFGAACEKPPAEAFRPQLSVYCLILAGWRQIWVSVNRTYAIDEPYDTVFHDADIKLWRRRDTWQLEYYAGDVYYVWLTPSDTEVRPRDEFCLMVTKDGYDTVLGQTVVPDTFSILSPCDSDDVTPADPMAWTQSRSCRGYDIPLQSIEGRDTNDFDLLIPGDSLVINPDSAVVRIPSMFFLYGFQPGPLALHVLALDTNYYDWLRWDGMRQRVSSRENHSHIIGGVGVVGSACERVVHVNIQPPRQ